MKTIKTYILLAAAFIMGGVALAQTIDTNPFYYGNEYKGDNLGEEQKTELAKVVKDDSVNSQDTTLLYKIRQYFRLTGTTTYDQDKPAIAYVQMIINMLLGLVSFISFILVIFAFYLIFFNKGEEGVQKAKKILIGVAIALVVMALSRIIVSFFFNLYTTEAIKNI